MDFFANHLNSLFQDVLLEEAHGTPTRYVGEERREVGLMKTHEFAECIQRSPGP